MSSRFAVRLLRAFAVTAVVLLASCQTVPQRSSLDWLGVLPGDATMYISVAVPKSADLIRKTLKEGGPAYNDVITLSNWTTRLLVSVTMAKETPMSFAAVALGGYPSVLLRMSLSGKKEWKEVKAPDGSYYAWNKANLQLSVLNNSVLLAANGQMPTLLSRYKTAPPLSLPPEVASDMEKSDVVLYMPQLLGGIGEGSTDQPAAEESGDRPRLAIREVWLDAVKSNDGYVLGGTMNTDTEQQARVLSLVVRVGIVAWMKSSNFPDVAERLKSISVSPEGRSVRVKGIGVRDDELVPIILTLLSGGSSSEGPAAPQAPQPPVPAQGSDQAN